MVYEIRYERCKGFKINNFLSIIKPKKKEIIFWDI